MAIVVLLLGLWLLWVPGQSPVFIFIFCFQWLQASSNIFHSNLLGVPVDELSTFGGDVSLAIALSLAGLAVLALGIRLGVGPATRTQDSEVVTALAAVWDKPPGFWLRCYAVAFVVALAAQSVAYVVPALSQSFLALAGLKFAFYWILTHVAFSRPGPERQLWLLVFFVELGLGFGFFSGFKTVLFFTAFGMLSAGGKMTGQRLLGLVSIVALTLLLGLGWTAIKTEQRSFLSRGFETQEVLVSYQDGLKNMVNLAGKLNSTDLAEAATDMAQRISYVDLFSQALATVPAYVPHENGAIWADAIIRPFMPRLLFSDKAAIHDSERTSYYTGLRVSGVDEGTSISIGYIGESYIDFGPYLMMLPILMLGWMYGRYYRWMVNYRYSRGVIGMGLATAVLFPAAYLESSITKLFGGLVVSMLVSWLLACWVLPKFNLIKVKKP